MSPLRKERRGLAGVWEPPAPVMLPLPGRSCTITSRGGNPTDPRAPGALEEERGEGFAHATVFLRCPFKAGALPAKPGDTAGKKEPGSAGGGLPGTPPPGAELPAGVVAVSWWHGAGWPREPAAGCAGPGAASCPHAAPRPPAARDVSSWGHGERRPGAFSSFPLPSAAPHF